MKPRDTALDSALGVTVPVTTLSLHVATGRSLLRPAVGSVPTGQGVGGGKTWSLSLNKFPLANNMSWGEGAESKAELCRQVRSILSDVTFKGIVTFTYRALGKARRQKH